LRTESRNLPEIQYTPRMVGKLDIGGARREKPGHVARDPRSL
jgi:hypothetical protein